MHSRIAKAVAVTVAVAALVLGATTAYGAARWHGFGFGTVRGTNSYLTVEGEVLRPDDMRFRVWDAKNRYMPAHWYLDCHDRGFDRYGSKSGTVRGRAPYTRTIKVMPVRNPYRCTLSVSVSEPDGWDRIHVQLFNTAQ